MPRIDEEPWAGPAGMTGHFFPDYVVGHIIDLLCPFPLCGVSAVPSRDVRLLVRKAFT